MNEARKIKEFKQHEHHLWYLLGYGRLWKMQAKIKLDVNWESRAIGFHPNSSCTQLGDLKHIPPSDFSLAVFSFGKWMEWNSSVVSKLISKDFGRSSWGQRENWRKFQMPSTHLRCFHFRCFYIFESRVRFYLTIWYLIEKFATCKSKSLKLLN